MPHHLSDRVGRVVPARSDILLQVHYHPSGKPEVDRTRLGLYFCKQPVRQTLHWANATNDTFRLPPGQKDIIVKASWNVPVDVEALAVTPHMHQLGREFQMIAVSPGGKTQNLLHIDAWDPNWQNTYFFEKRVSLPKGSIVKIVAHFDNSAHPRNPNSPPKAVYWGPQVTDEMCVGYIGVVKKGQDSDPARREGRPVRDSRPAVRSKNPLGGAAPEAALATNHLKNRPRFQTPINPDEPQGTIPSTSKAPSLPLKPRFSLRHVLMDPGRGNLGDLRYLINLWRLVDLSVAIDRRVASVIVACVRGGRGRSTVYGGFAMKRFTPCAVRVRHDRRGIRKPVLELLEDRQLLSAITVNTTSDDDVITPASTTISLRQAIELSNGTLAYAARLRPSRRSSFRPRCRGVGTRFSSIFRERARRRSSWGPARPMPGLGCRRSRAS